MIRVRLTTCVTLLVLSLQVACMAAESGRETTFIGQWVWSARDAKIFSESARGFPGLVPCVWVSTVYASDGKVLQRLANPPDIAGHDGPVAVVVRFDDSFTSIWKSKNVKDVARELDERLAKLTGILADTGVGVTEVQLDYDCPVRLLEDWAKVVRELKARCLAGRDVWITSLPCHMDVPGYGSWFRGSVSGHIIQVFDTGVSCDSATVEVIAGKLGKQKMAFRVGLGAFERSNSSGSTDHRQWFFTLDSFSSIPGYKGVWVFPGGNRWDYLI